MLTQVDYMFYPVTMTKKGEYAVRDLGMTCKASNMEEACDKFVSTMAEYIETNFRKAGKPIPTPSELHADDGVIALNLRLQARILLWNLLKDRFMSTSEFARQFGVSRQYAQFMVDGNGAVSLEKYCDAFEMLGYYPSLMLNRYK